MPIEIRELVIRATVDPGEAGGSSSCGGDEPASGTGKQGRSGSQAQSPDDLVQTCVREVLRILDEKRER